MRYILRITGGAFILFAILWLLANVLISLKKDSIHDILIHELTKHVEGEITIGDLSPEYFRTFPNISIRFSDVALTDSLGTLRERNFFKAENIFAQIQFFSLLRGKPAIGKIIIENGLIYLFKDECGNSNFNSKGQQQANKANHDFPEFTLKNTRIIIENEFRNSYHDILAKDLDCTARKKSEAVMFNIDMDALMRGIGFNLERGSYLKEKSIAGKFMLTFYPGKKISFNDILLKIDKHPYSLTGDIFLDTDTTSYDLLIQTKKVNYQQGVSLLTESLQGKLDSISIDKPIDVETKVSGPMVPKAVPRIHTTFTITDSQMETALGRLEHCTFSGSFSNHFEKNLLPGDVNSKLIFNDVYAAWYGVQLTSPHVEILNFIQPVLTCHLKSVFDLTHLNEITESSTIEFIKGTGNLDIQYHGSLFSGDTTNPVANGTFSLNNAAFNYLPRNLLLENCTGVIEFRNEDLNIPQMSASIGSTNLNVSGDVENLFALINISPEKLTMDWKVTTPHLNLNDFLSYVAPKVIYIKKPVRNNRLSRATENIDRLLRDGIAELNIQADKLTYKNFIAHEVAASVRMVENKILIHDAALKHAGGSASIKGSLTSGKNHNLVAIQSGLKNVDIPGIFRAFNNFGQDAITYSNMKGKMSAKISASVALTNNAAIIENSMIGKVDFKVSNGELINFEPAMKIAATAFKNRDFSHIKFSELEDHLEINGTAITVDKMEIRSNVVILFVEGIYDTKKGTDMSIQVPLSNLSRAEHDIMYKKGRSGVNVRLWAKTQEDGNLKISWDPFNKATKKRWQEE